MDFDTHATGRNTTGRSLVCLAALIIFVIFLAIGKCTFIVKAMSISEFLIPGLIDYK